MATTTTTGFFLVQRALSEIGETDLLSLGLPVYGQTPEEIAATYLTEAEHQTRLNVYGYGEMEATVSLLSGAKSAPVPAGTWDSRILYVAYANDGDPLDGKVVTQIPRYRMDNRAPGAINRTGRQVPGYFSISPVGGSSSLVFSEPVNADTDFTVRYVNAPTTFVEADMLADTANVSSVDDRHNRAVYLRLALRFAQTMNKRESQPDLRQSIMEATEDFQNDVIVGPTQAIIALNGPLGKGAPVLPVFNAGKGLGS